MDELPEMDPSFRLLLPAERAREIFSDSAFSYTIVYVSSSNLIYLLAIALYS